MTAQGRERFLQCRPNRLPPGGRRTGRSPVSCTFDPGQHQHLWQSPIFFPFETRCYFRFYPQAIPHLPFCRLIFGGARFKLLSHRDDPPLSSSLQNCVLSTATRRFRTRCSPHGFRFCSPNSHLNHTPVVFFCPGRKSKGPCAILSTLPCPVPLFGAYP